MNAYQFDLGETSMPRRRNTWFKLGAFVAGTAVVAALLVYSGGFDAVLKFLGVGASGIYEVTLTNNNQWLGAEYSSDDWIVGAPIMDGVDIFASFSAAPADPHLDAAQRGLVLPTYSSPADPGGEIFLNHMYISPTVDLTLDAVWLSAIEVTDFTPEGSSISYSYRWAASLGGLDGKSFTPLDPSVVNSLSGDVRVATAIIEQSVAQYVQIKFVFGEVADPLNARPAVYAVSFQYKDTSELSESELASFSATAVVRMVSIQYQPLNAPKSADIDIISSELDERIVHSVKNVDLSERLSYSFETELPGGAYAVAVSAPGIKTIVMPFMADSSPNIAVDLGSFETSIGQATGADLNGDGVVNSLDLQILLSQFAS
ncbi:hypothetical protein A2V68_02440 [candidate division Kazan bacterium RBG_13_50_9]|uniref:Dockerin domain-containing protein n=1 Tax=candidate division Kazan bacterium RBG_13_50_9 TaxID=1798535 RepID=A0A1F4NRE6_UNCK3|nr:MAG: hypothetical protein A2V68_02440 [candidate division Kazan bacterium RBG_13_50_9]